MNVLSPPGHAGYSGKHREERCKAKYIRIRPRLPKLKETLGLLYKQRGELRLRWGSKGREQGGVGGGLGGPAKGAEPPQLLAATRARIRRG